MPFEFKSNLYGSGIVVDMEPDGNCGFRGLSWALTGTQENHEEIRRDIMQFTQRSIRLYRAGIDGHDWWRE